MNSLNKENIIGVAALLVHAAKIDEKYSDKEKDLIKDFVRSYLKDDNLDEILKSAEELENNSEVLWISDPHTNIHFWKENGKFFTSKEFHLSKGGLEKDFDEWSKKVDSISD